LKLYHFTAAHLLPRVKREGLTLGRIPWRKGGKTVLVPGYQWLTSNPEFDQSWCNVRYSSLPYDRLAYRITVMIPRDHLPCLLPWLDVCQKNEMKDVLNDFGDPENWYVFKGRIKPGWFREVVSRGLCP